MVFKPFTVLTSQKSNIKLAQLLGELEIIFKFQAQFEYLVYYYRSSFLGRPQKFDGLTLNK